MGATRLPSKRPPAVIVRFNGRRIATFAVQSGMTEHRVELPAWLQRRGANELAFGSRMGHGAERLEVVYDTLRVLSVTGERRQPAQVSGDGISLPPQSGVNYFLRLPDSPELRLGVEDGRVGCWCDRQPVRGQDHAQGHGDQRDVALPVALQGPDEICPAIPKDRPRITRIERTTRKFRSQNP
jgi:hypothetical protein